LPFFTILGGLVDPLLCYLEVKVPHGGGGGGGGGGELFRVLKKKIFVLVSCPTNYFRGGKIYPICGFLRAERGGGGGWFSGGHQGAGGAPNKFPPTKPRAGGDGDGC